MISTLLCPDSVPQFLGLFDLSIAPRLLFYSYIPVLLVSLFLSIYIYLKNKDSISSKLLFLMIFFFELWVLDVLILWTAAPAKIVMFFWQIVGLLEMTFFILGLFFIYSFGTNQKIPRSIKILFLSPLIFILIFLPTELNISAFDLTYCEGLVGPLWYFIYGFELLCLPVLVWIGVKKYKQEKALKKSNEKQILYITFGMFAFLALSSISNIVAEITGIYTLDFIGPIGMVIFLSFLVYFIVNYRTFGIKAFWTQALVGALWILIGSLLFVVQTVISQIIVTFTLVTAIFLGIFLIRSVRKEIEQREEIGRLAQNLSASNHQLKVLNEQKSEFLSIASHQFRAPLTAIKGYTSLLLEETYGPLTQKVKEPVDRIFQSATNLGLIVDDFLNLSRIEQGRMKYEFETVSISEFIQQAVDELHSVAEKKGLTLTFVAHSDTYFASIDRGKFKQVITNLIDNAIKYTPAGGITITLSKHDSSIRIRIQDTGIGIAKESIGKLFEQFSRASNANTVNIIGTGLGLYIAKKLVEAHKGKVWVESEGEGKGSSFFIEIPAK